MHGQRRFQRAVKHSIAGRVHKIRNQDCVLVSQSRRALVFEVEEVSKHCGGYDQRSQRDRRAALVALDLTDEVLGARSRLGRLFSGLSPRGLSAA